MQSIRPALLAAACLFAILPAGRTQEIILETGPGVEAALYCEMLHSTNCTMIHVETQTTLATGASLQIDGKPYVITWMGPGYYLETGVVLEAQGDVVADLRGQRWLEIKPHEGKVHTSRVWKDTDRNQALSRSDTLALDDGPDVEDKDVRLHLRVKPVPEKK